MVLAIRLAQKTNLLIRRLEAVLFDRRKKAVSRQVHLEEGPLFCQALANRKKWQSKLAILRNS